MSFSTLETDVANFINDPEWCVWLKSLLGDSPLLGRSEYEFISQVELSIIREVGSRPKVPSKHHLANKLSVMKDNFEQVVKHLKKNSESKKYFLQNYPSWRNCRDLSMLRLLEIAKVVNDNSKESASVRCLGGTVSLAGGLMALVPGLGALRLAGGVLVGLGSLATMGATFVEFQTLKEKIEEAEKIMLQDREYSEKLWNWMSDGSHLQEAYNTITSIDVTWRKVAADLFDCFKMKRKHGAKTAHMKMIIEKVVKKFFPNYKADDIIQVIGILLAIYMLHERCRSLFNIASETYRSKGILIAAREVAASAVKMAVVSAGQSSKLNPFQKGSRGIGIALDVINIIHASKDFDETSKESVAIAKAAKQLKEEADIFKKLYDAVTCA